MFVRLNSYLSRVCKAKFSIIFPGLKYFRITLPSTESLLGTTNVYNHIHIAVLLDFLSTLFTRLLSRPLLIYVYYSLRNQYQSICRIADDIYGIIYCTLAYIIVCVYTRGRRFLLQSHKHVHRLFPALLPAIAVLSCFNVHVCSNLDLKSGKSAAYGLRNFRLPG